VTAPDERPIALAIVVGLTGNSSSLLRIWERTSPSSSPGRRRLVPPALVFAVAPLFCFAALPETLPLLPSSLRPMFTSLGSLTLLLMALAGSSR
jgi:hypothetical protein